MTDVVLRPRQLWIPIDVFGANPNRLNQCVCEISGSQVRLRVTDVLINSDREQFEVTKPAVAQAAADQLQLLARLPKEFFACFDDYFLFNIGTARLFELTCAFKSGVQSMQMSFLCQDSGYGDTFDFIQAATLHAGDETASIAITRKPRLVLTLELPQV